MQLTKVLLKKLKKGTFFKRKETSTRIFTRQEYDRHSGKYSCRPEDDINDCLYLSGGTAVFIGFEY